MTIKKYTIKSWVTLFVMIFVIVLAGCSASKAPEEAKYDNVKTEAQEERKESQADSNGFANSGTAQGNNPDNATTDAAYGKIIRRAYVEMQTKDFDNAVAKITDKTNAVGGYIEQSEVTGKSINATGRVQNRYAAFTLRVPKEEFHNLLLGLSEIGNVITNQTSSEDITGQYFDTEASLGSKKIQEERLLSILEKAETIEDVIKLEESLAQVRYEIENLSGTIKKWDNLIDYTTIKVNVSEVQEISETKVEPITLGGRMKDGFVESMKALTELLEGLLVGGVMILPFIVLIGVILIPVWLLRKSMKKKQKGDKE